MGKIIISGSSFGSGGAERVMANLSYILPDHFDEVIIVLWRKQEVFYISDPRAKVLWLEDEAGRGEYRQLMWFRNFVKQERPNLILSFLEPFNLRVLLSTIGLKTKVVVAERNDPRVMNGSRLMDLIEKSFYRRAAGILVQTKTIAEFFDGNLRDKTTIIYNPVSIDAENVGLALKTSKEKRIVCVARLMPQKKHELLIQSFRCFLQNHSGYFLDLYGEGPLEDSLRDSIIKEGLEDSVFIRGAKKNIHQEIASAQMFVLVSDREGMSNAMIEAMCLGLPCICTKVSGAIDLIESGENGILVDIGNVDQVVSAMTEISDRPELAEKIGENATKLYNRLNPQKIYSEWLSYIDSYRE